jgi:Protein of unknown function (DUF3352)
MISADTEGTMSDVTPPQEPLNVPASPTALPEPRAPKARGPRILLLAAITVAVLLVGGGAAAFFSLRGAPETILDKIPATADVVVVARLNPAASQKMNLFRMAGRIPALGSREELSRKVNDMLDAVLGDASLSHEDLSWVGGEAGGYVDLGSGSPSYAIMVASDNDGAAADTLQKLEEASGASYATTQISGVDVAVPDDTSQPTTAIVDSVVVLASGENVMRTVIDTADGGASIAGDPMYQRIADALPADNLGMVYENTTQLNRLLASMGGLDGLIGTSQQLGAAQAVGMSVSATSQGLALDVVSQNDPAELTQAERDALVATDGPSPLLPMVPSDAYAVAAMRGVTSQLERSVGQMSQLDPEIARQIEKLDLLGPDGLLSKLSGDVAFQVGPGQGLLPVSGTVMVGVTDAAGVERWLHTHLPKLLTDTGIGGLTWSTEDYKGTTIYYTDPLLSGGVPLAWGMTDGAWVLGVSRSSVEQAVDLDAGSGSSIASNPNYQAAIAQLPGTESVLYVDVQGIVSMVKGFVPGDAYQRFLDEGGSNLEPITLVAAGSESDEQGSRSTLLIEIP